MGIIVVIGGVEWKLAQLTVVDQPKDLSMCDGRTSVTGSGDQDGERPLGAAAKPREDAGEETSAEVLERQRRSMKQLQHMVVSIDRDERRFEVEGLFEDALELTRGDFVTGVGRHDFAGDFRKLELRKRTPETIWQLRHRGGHVESAIGCEAVTHSLTKRSVGALAGGAMESHRLAGSVRRSD